MLGQGSEDGKEFDEDNNLMYGRLGKRKNSFFLNFGKKKKQYFFKRVKIGC